MPVPGARRILNGVLGPELVRHMDDRDRMDAFNQRGLIRRHPHAMMPNNIQWGPVTRPRVIRAPMPYGHVQHLSGPPCPFCGGIIEMPMRQPMRRIDRHAPCCLNCLNAQLQRGRQRRPRRLLPGPSPGHGLPHHYLDDPRMWREDDDDLFDDYDDDDDEYEYDYGDDGELDYDDEYDGHTDISRRSYHRLRPGRRHQAHRGHAPRALAPPRRGGHHGGVHMPRGHGHGNPFATYPGYHGEFLQGYGDDSSDLSW